jgi:hypothetical protein
MNQNAEVKQKLKAARDELEEYIGNMISLVCTGDKLQDKNNMKELVETIYERTTVLFKACQSVTSGKKTIKEGKTKMGL